jgi:integrase
MPLTETQLRKAKKQAKPYKKSDGGGLYVMVMPDGTKCWRLAYRCRGKQGTLALGVYPAVTLADARQARDAAKQQLADGVDPSNRSKARAHIALVTADTTFEVVAREWHEQQKPGWSEDYAAVLLRRLQMDVFPVIGHRPIASIEPSELLEMLRKAESRGVVDLAHRLKQYVGMVFRFAISSGRAQRDPSADLRDALKAAPAETRHPQAMPRQELPGFLRSLGGYDGDQQTRLALGLFVLTLVRTKELRAGRWEELAGLDGPEPFWRIPPERTRNRRERLVPLSRQAVAVLRELRKQTGNNPFMFPSASPDGHMSEHTCLYALYRLGYHGRATLRGLRGVASGLLNENGFETDRIERQAAHAEGDASRAADNSTGPQPQHRRMMQWWADYLDTLIDESNNVVPLALAS